MELGRSESGPKQTDAERARTVVGAFVLHLRPVRVPEATIRFIHTFGLGGMSRDRNPDLLVSYNATFAMGETKMKVYSSGVAYATGVGWTTLNGAGLVTVTDLPVGTLLVDLADPKKKELVWRATASHGIDKNASLEGRERIVSGAIAKIFEGFPPGK